MEEVKVQSKIIFVRFSAMANSKYEYVKSFEVEDEIMLPNIIVVRVDARDFCRYSLLHNFMISLLIHTAFSLRWCYLRSRFSEVHEFEKPNDKQALELMNECTKAVSEQFPDVMFSYGYSDEYR